jgi:hypothetical protein
MAKRRKKKGVNVELFPFLSILSCVIGVLTLMITGLALGQLNPEDSARIVRAERNRELLEMVRADEKKVAELRELIARAKAVSAALEAANRELERLRESQADTAKAEGLAKDETAKLLAEADNLFRRIEQLKPELTELEQEIARIKAEIEKRKLPPEPAQVHIRPGGSGSSFTPVFIECTARDIAVYQDPDGEPTRYLRSGLRTNLEFIALVDKIAADPKKQIVFLVREDAYYMWRDANAVANSRYCINGMLPVVGQGKIDLSAFDPARGR